jgi:transposase-like protein
MPVVKESHALFERQSPQGKNVPFPQGGTVLLQFEMEIARGDATEWASRKGPDMKRIRRNFTAEQKVSILREHLVERVPVSDVCDKHQIQPTLFYQWQKTLFEKGTAAFEVGRSPSRGLGHQERKLLVLEGKLKDRTEALAELMEEHVRLKKSFGGI